MTGVRTCLLQYDSSALLVIMASAIPTSSIKPMDGTLTGITSPSRRNLRVMELEPHHQIQFTFIRRSCPVSWGCRIPWLLLCSGVRPLTKECPGYDTKQSDAEVPVMLELWGMQSTPSLPSLLGPLWPRVVAPDKGPINGLNRTRLCTYAKLNCLNYNCLTKLNSLK